MLGPSPITPRPRPAGTRKGSESVSLSPDVIGGRSKEELVGLLLQADAVIRAREKDLSIAANLGKSLLSENNALRAKQHALATQINPSSTEDDSYIEDMPPPSPASHVIDTKRAVSFSMSKSVSNRSITSENEDPYTPSPITSPTQSIRRSRRSSVAHRRSISSATSTVYHSARSLSEKSLSASLNGHSLTQLVMQNDELATQIEELEQETARADVAGKKRLKKLEKELGGLRKELEAAVDRNAELEAQLHRTNTSPPHSLSSLETSFSHNSIFSTLSHSSSIESQLTSTDTDFDKPTPVTAPAVQFTNSSFSYNSPTLVTDTFSNRSSISDQGQPTTPTGEQALVAELLAKIAELEEANGAIAAEKQDLDVKLTKAQDDISVLKLGFEELEEAVKHNAHARTVSWDRKGFLEWPSASQSGGSEPATPERLRRRPLGNQGMIKQSRYHKLGHQPASVDRPYFMARSTSGSSFFDEEEWDENTAREDVLQAIQREHDDHLHSLQASPANHSNFKRSPSAASSIYPRSVGAGRTLGSELGDWEGTSRRLQYDDYDSDQEQEQERTDTESTATQGNNDFGNIRPEHAIAIAAQLETDPQSWYLTNPSSTLIEPGSLCDDNPPDAESYELLERSLAELPIQWSDHPDAIIAAPVPSDRPTEGLVEGGWSWDQDCDDPDPWEEEEKALEERRLRLLSRQKGKETGSSSRLGIDTSPTTGFLESKEAIRERERSEARIERRRRKLRDIAKRLRFEAANQHDENFLCPSPSSRPTSNVPLEVQREQALQELRLETSSKRIRKISSTASIRRRTSSPSLRRQTSSSSLVSTSSYEDISPTTREGDYFPSSMRQYTPAMVITKFQHASLYWTLWVTTWVRFLIVLGAAIAVAVWRGPKQTMGLKRLESNKSGNK